MSRPTPASVRNKMPNFMRTSSGAVGWANRSVPTRTGGQKSEIRTQNRKSERMFSDLRHLISRSRGGHGACSIRLLAADLFLEKFHTPWNRGSMATKRPRGPFGIACVHSLSATCGASRLATAHALGGLKINAPLPEISHLLLELLSQALTSGGRNANNRLL